MQRQNAHQSHKEKRTKKMTKIDASVFAHGVVILHQDDPQASRLQQPLYPQIVYPEDINPNLKLKCIDAIDYPIVSPLY